MALQEYIDKNKDKCLTPERVPVLLKGKKELLFVYNIPLDYLYFNIKNGRFKAEYLELVRKNGGKELDPTKKDDAKKIQTLLLNLDLIETKRTTLDIKQRGQWNPGIMTHDGFVIDGNRRLSILQNLAREDSKFNVMKVARLPSTVDKNDLWKLEAGIQLGKDEIVRYGPINELLKLKEGVDANLSPSEIANTLYGFKDDSEIIRKLDRLKLIEEYLEFNGVPQKYSKVKGKVEHFINAQNILDFYYAREADMVLRKALRRAIWALISDGRSHLEIRKIRDMIKLESEKALEWIKKIAEKSKPIPPNSVVTTPEKTLAEHVSETIDHEFEAQEVEEDDSKPSEVKTMWINAIEALNVVKNKNDLPRLLGNALENLDGLDYTSEQLKTKQCNELIQQILRHAEKLKTKLG
ncbi:MAG: hypothetical protein K8Q89_09355 [Nitrosarchaeum sp.]|nr:hypothetical protein [Nitrosarchaeum sp.]